MSLETVHLSFCIPIYNFGKFIGETIESIVANIPPSLSVEILVLDGGSTDETSDLMSGYVQRYPVVRYLRKETRGGIDEDLNLAVSAAKGEYCWLLSGDDTLCVDAVSRLCHFLDSKCDVYVCEHNQCDLELRFLYEYPIFSERSVQTVDLANAASRQMYLSNALNTEACFSFMSSLIVRRTVWLSLEPPAMFKGSCWWHVARLFEHMKRQLKVCYVGETWINRRGDNDSFLDRGVVRRLGIAIDGYHDLANYYFGFGSVEAFHIRRLVRADIKFLIYLHAKLLTSENPNSENRTDLDRIVARAYCDRNIKSFICRILYYVVSADIYRWTRNIWRFSRRYFGFANLRGRPHA